MEDKVVSTLTTGQAKKLGRLAFLVLYSGSLPTVLEQSSAEEEQSKLVRELSAVLAPPVLQQFIKAIK